MGRSADEAIKYLLSQRGKNLSEQQKDEIVDEVMRDLLPSYYELQKLEEEYKKSPGYAFHKLEEFEKRYSDHLAEFHTEGTCDEACHKKHFGDLKVDEYKEYMKTVYEYVVDHFENTSDA